MEVQVQDKHRNTSLVPAQALFQVNPYFWMDYHFQIPAILCVLLAILALQQWWKRYQILWNSEKKYKSMVEQDTHTLILYWNSEYILTYANECAQKFLGIQPGDIYQLDVLDACFSINQKSKEAFNQAIQRVLKEPDSNRLFHLSMTGPNQSSFMISWLIRIIWRDNNQIDEIHSFGTNITEQYRMEKDLSRERISFREFCEASHIGVFRLSRNSELLFANSAMAQIAGFETADEMMQHPEPIQWFQKQHYNRFIESVFRQKLVQPIPLRGRQAKTGKEIAVFLYGLLKEDELEIMVLDLTKQKNLDRDIVLASTREQQKIGRDLHDTIIQELTGILFLGQTLLGRLEEDRAEGVEELSSLLQILEDVRNRTQKITKGLAPINLGKLWLHSALQEVVYTIEHLYHIQCEYEYDHHIRIENQEAKLNLYLIAHEALMNAAKHSMADSISLRLEMERNSVLMSIRDNGIGLKNLDAQKGMGIEIMNCRAGMIMADLVISIPTEGGTLVECRYPIH